ncbi:unnamed protein product [Penicillium pancosmium]
MSHRVNLGQACFQTADSPLKLQLTATGHFKLPITSSNYIPQIQDMQLRYILSAWTTEAPELELRLHFDINPRLEWTLSSLVWSDLGSTIVFKSHETSENTNASRISCLVFGICRGAHSQNQIISRRVPSILRNPPGAHPPTSHPVIYLAAIDIYLEYSLPLATHPEIKTEVDEIAPSGDFLQILEPDPAHYSIPPVIYISDNRYSEDDEIQCEAPGHWQFTNLYLLGQDPSLNQHPLSQEHDGSTDGSDLSAAYQLLDKSLRRLVLEGPSRVHQTDSAQSESLEKMSDLAPVIFNPVYRQAMEQRAVSIPIISQAITSMVEGSQNAELKRMAEILLQSVDNSVPSDTASLPSQRRLNHAIQSSLWCIAQTKLRGTKNTVKATSFFDVSESTSPNATVDGGFNMLLERDTYFNDELLDSTTYTDLSQSTYYSGEAAIWPDDWMNEDYDEINDAASYFEYISDSDPTMVDSFFSPCENPQSPFSSSASGMLLSDEDDDVAKDASDFLFDF